MNGNLHGALTALDWAFSLGADEEYVRTFADEGEPLAALLEKYISAVEQFNTKIYGKPGVKNRYEAIEKARELGLTE